MILESGATNLLQGALLSTNLATATNCIRALANTKSKEAIHLITPLVSDETRPLVVRREAVKSLVQSQEGARIILELAEEQELPDALKFAASSELHRAPWPEIRAKAEKALPRPAALNAQALPPVAELVKMKGDSVKGEKVFNSPTAGCATCHQVKGQGVDFGPNLTEIGSKLAKEALYESILDPSAGISFGYEAWNIELKSGDEVYGLIVSETPEELSLKSVGGAVAKCKISEIAHRTKATLSIMPAGLQQNMSAQDLIDLVEYLASLKKPGT
jgi:putative heme-binding domain-containing protein